MPWVADIHGSPLSFEMPWVAGKDGMDPMIIR